MIKGSLLYIGIMAIIPLYAFIVVGIIVLIVLFPLAVRMMLKNYTVKYVKKHETEEMEANSETTTQEGVEETKSKADNYKTNATSVYNVFEGISMPSINETATQESIEEETTPKEETKVKVASGEENATTFFEKTSMPSINISGSLAMAMRDIVDKRGRDELNSKICVNILDDFQAFKDVPSAKKVLQNIIHEGYMTKALQISSWSLESRSLATKFVYEFGTQEAIVSFVFQSIGYALGKADMPQKPELSTQNQSSLVSTCSPKQIHGELKNESIVKDTVSSPSHASTLTHSSGLLPINPKEPWVRYKMPDVSLLNKQGLLPVDDDSITKGDQRILETLNKYGIGISEIKTTYSPTAITLIELTPAPNCNIATLRRHKDNIAFELGAIKITVPKTSSEMILIEMPHEREESLSIRDVIDCREFRETTLDLPVVLGRTVKNEPLMFDLAESSQLFIAGSTGQGKSVCINTIITSLLYKKHPNEVKFVLIDPKLVEFSLYEHISSHFMAATVENVEDPIITDDNNAIETIQHLNYLLDDRYKLLKKAGVRNIKEYNEKFVNRELPLAEGHEYMPYVVTIIDEVSNLILNYKKEFESPLVNLAKLGKAVGMPIIIATNQSALALTKGVKANFFGRIAFHVSTDAESRNVIGQSGAESLLNSGDMVCLVEGKVVRAQCAMVTTNETEKITMFISAQPGPIEPLMLPESEFNVSINNNDIDSCLDPYFDQAAQIIIATQTASTSVIQRQFSIGYNRAGRIMDQLERAGVVGPPKGTSPREVMIQDPKVLSILLKSLK